MVNIKPYSFVKRWTTIWTASQTCRCMFVVMTILCFLCLVFHLHCIYHLNIDKLPENLIRNSIFDRTSECSNRIINWAQQNWADVVAETVADSVSVSFYFKKSLSTKVEDMTIIRKKHFWFQLGSNGCHIRVKMAEKLW